MINKIIMYSATCDGCNNDWDNGDGIMAYHEPDTIQDSIQDSSWHIDEETKKTYCPNCYHMGDDDNIITKEFIPA